MAGRTALLVPAIIAVLFLLVGMAVAAPSHAHLLAAAEIECAAEQTACRSDRRGFCIECLTRFLAAFKECQVNDDVTCSVQQAFRTAVTVQEEDCDIEWDYGDYGLWLDCFRKVMTATAELDTHA
eukprot:g11651.t1